MTDPDHPVPTPAERADTAVARARELGQRRAELAAGAPSTPSTVQHAERRADDAHDRAARAHQAAADRHHDAADAHRRAAELHERAIAQGLGDAQIHRAAAAAHRRAATADDVAASIDQHDADADIKAKQNSGSPQSPRAGE